jgi:hypothetical protein
MVASCSVPPAVNIRLARQLTALRSDSFTGDDNRVNAGGNGILAAPTNADLFICPCSGAQAQGRGLRDISILWDHPRQ